MIHVDVTIVGAGIIGLSAACAISGRGRQVLLLEKEPGPGRETSSRNSEVIHAGIYYPTGSLKATLCVKGARMLYSFCEKHQIPFQRIGKVIVAAGAHEEQAVEGLWKKGMENGAEGLVMLSRTELQRREPYVSGASALLSPNTGIIDSHRLIRHMEAHALSRGCTILYNTRLTGIDRNPQGYTCMVEGLPPDRYSFQTTALVNAAGLYADSIASLAGIDVDRAAYRIFPVKGQYFRVRGKKQGMVNGLVYPSPERNLTGLGIHVTKDLSGSVRLGPDARYVDTLNYEVDPAHASEFLTSVRTLLPFLSEGDLLPDMAGVRPKIQPPGGEVRDFVIHHEADRGLPGLISLIGIESPGLTSCLAIGEMVSDLLRSSGLL
ncbi:MAG TPA: NAD(P)/FAD-dependent oxidoreductase [Deltaproteobacteria bacterium]|nr:NAD(P)/FAD-dependent oxidoreductase [Deltaproteobacteria bacterium]